MTSREFMVAGLGGIVAGGIFALFMTALWFTGVPPAIAIAASTVFAVITALAIGGQARARGSKYANAFEAGGCLMTSIQTLLWINHLGVARGAF